ncbi:hypothetical protein DICPUDRAFT_48677 [Dictyostelium purpureum]|uniref:I/LWEQ domain-containing protein n=1 Tax=Dictyostelium purpureum TaxID=5786 RepID=F0ZQ61_DICPU|nr:uncharacterized protein DICPUDRAFT_48677 [Dictyostelium purpureum]EGC33912.1 hypothetical protein DICPUDRAFT_48677 [Dictyostelium purpureum]|eukprot:XP_003289547.1 hypothetical protein DICPUDRAFT_48677 [Dictyostelium purpureum]
MTEFEAIVHKATNSKVTAPKRKHVRSIVLECYSENSARTFFMELYRRPLDSNDVVCYKALITIHKVIQEGPKNVLGDTISRVQWFEGLRDHWARYDNRGFGHLVAEYCTLLIDKIRFHQAHPEFDGGLSLENYSKTHRPENIEVDRGLQQVSHLMDLMDACFRMHNTVVNSTPYNDCKTSSFIPLVLESYAIYILIVHFFTHLVDKVDSKEVIDFSIKRFYGQYQTLRNFYLNASAITSVSSVIAVPNLPPDPPKFIRKVKEQPKPKPKPTPLPVVEKPPQPPTPPPQPEQIPVPVPTPVFIRQTVPVVYGAPYMQQQDNNSMWGQFGSNNQPMYQDPNLLAQQQAMLQQQQLQQQLLQQQQQQALLQQQMANQSPQQSSQWVTFGDNDGTTRQRSTSTPPALEKKEANVDKTASPPKPQTANSNGATDSQGKTRVITKIITKTVNNTSEINALKARIEELEKLLQEEIDKNKALTLKLSEREAMIQEVTAARKRLQEMTSVNDNYTAEVVKQNDQLREQLIAIRDWTERQRLLRLEKEFGSINGNVSQYLQLLDNPNNLGNPEATHQMVIEDLLHHMQQANRLHELCNQEGDDLEMDIFAAVNSVSDSLKDLFHDSKGSSRLIVDPELQSKFMDAARKIGALTQNLFESVRLQGGQCQDDEDRKRLANNLASLKGGVNALDALAQQADADRIEKEKKYLESGFDLDDIAERELLAAAKTIEDAANSLLAAKSKREPKKEGDAPDVAEAILEAAMAITSATSTLVGAATLAQRERIEKGRTSDGGPMYRKDPTWAEGLISAAKAVAAATKALVDTANKAASGQEIVGGTEEALIATSKAVTAATSQLVSACKSKSDINSPSQHKLTNAAKSVQNATNLLVAAARAVAAKVASEEEIDFDKLSVTGYKVKEMEQQMAIIRLEKELEVARKGLSVLRKNVYTNQN